MDKDIHTPRIPLFSELEEPHNYELYIYGTAEIEKQHEDAFCSAIDRYLSELDLTQAILSRMTGIAPSTLSRYLSGKRKIGYDYLCAVCIALRLHPCRQRHLFTLLRYSMPCDQDFSKHDERIIRAYLDGCAFVERYTLIACNGSLSAAGCKPLTKLTSDTEEQQ